MSAATRTLTAVTSSPYKWISEDQVSLLAGDPDTRLTPILIRCGACRFTAPAQNVAHVIAALEAAGDYVRDASLPVTG